MLGCKACGFTQSDEKKLVVDEDELFISIDGKFTISTGDSYHRHQVDVSLVACPKCRTVQMLEPF